MQELVLLMRAAPRPERDLPALRLWLDRAPVRLLFLHGDAVYWSRDQWVESLQAELVTRVPLWSFCTGSLARRGLRESAQQRGLGIMGLGQWMDAVDGSTRHVQLS